ncbi:MAG: protein-disulfide reductase DsbD domain-containing protein [Mucilaginibacter sp.]|uniref:protein-disulfide reductase DsbD domain-containing protein n=1 Tax=Mucilaginibacter sp. TaxID=1882438 RepID=UPI0032664BEE
MKKTALFILLMIAMSTVNAQILTPVRWSYGFKKKSATEAMVFMKADIDEGWHVYSQTVKDGGPIKTTFTFSPSKEFTLVGKTIEPTPVTRNEKTFNMDVSFFERQVIFQQKIKLKNGKATVKGTLEYMTCNDQKCLPPEDLTFSIVIK